MSKRRPERGLVMPRGRSIPRPPSKAADRPPLPGEGEIEWQLGKAGAELAALVSEIRSCPVCRSRGDRCAFGSGFPRAPLMLVKERPSEEDLETETAFVSEAAALHRALDRLGIPFGSAYGSSVMRAGEGPATDEDLRTCSVHLLTEIEAVYPRVLVAFGPRVVDALRALDGRCGLTVPGELQAGTGLPLRPGLVMLATEPLPEGVTDPDAKRRLWRDMQALPDLLA